ncbi:MAG: hypothetical protein V3W41_17930 [Planctomycetota bacterium]
MINQSYTLLRNALLSNVVTTPALVDEIDSEAVTAPTHSMRVNVAILNLEGTSASLKVAVLGSYDGVVWQVKGLSGATVTVNAASDAPPVTEASSAVVDVDYPFIRLRAAVSGTGATVRFDSELVFSDQ